MKNPSLPEIRCAICNKLVDEVFVEENNYEMKVRVLAFCHGQKDTAEFDFCDFAMLGKELAQQPQIAFRAKALEGPTNALPARHHKSSE